MVPRNVVGSTGALVAFDVNGASVSVPDDGSTLLQVLRDQLGIRSVKDGCSPQGQCGCCTVWVDGRPRVACVTAVRRVAGRRVTTVDGLPAEVRERWAAAFLAAGASQCGFCTPGIVMRLAAFDGWPGPDSVRRALAAHLCRCTGWQSVIEAAAAAYGVVGETAGPHVPDERTVGDRAAPDGPALPDLPALDDRAHDRGARDDQGKDRPHRPRRQAAPRRDLALASRRATLEAGTAQRVGMDVVLGGGGFADDTAPADALVAVPDGRGDWVVAETLAEARRQAGAVPGRRTTRPLRHPLPVPNGPWVVRWKTTFVEPAFLEPDASWCVPGGEPASPLANGGAFGGKVHSPAPAAARLLAERTGRPVRVVLSREDVVRAGPKRPPLAAGVATDGTGVVRVARTPGSCLEGWADALRSAAPGLVVEVVDTTGPPVSSAIRGAGWVEGAVLSAALAMLRDPACSAVPSVPTSLVTAPGASAGIAAPPDAPTSLLTAPRPPGASTGIAPAPPAAAPTQAPPGGPTQLPAAGTGIAVAPGAAARRAAEVTTPAGARAAARIDADGAVTVTVWAGEVLDEVVLRSYCIGAAHQALGWVWREALSVDDDGVVHDLTIRSFGVLPARDMPPVAVVIEPSAAPPVPAGDAVLAAVAAAAWARSGFAPAWPTARGER